MTGLLFSRRGFVLLILGACLLAGGCQSLRNHPLAGDRVPSRPWENTRQTWPAAEKPFCAC